MFVTFMRRIYQWIAQISYISCIFVRASPRDLKRDKRAFTPFDPPR